MKVSELSILGPMVIETDKFYDDRGFFRELYRSDVYNNIIPAHTWVQTNHSKSRMNVLRGLHFQFGEAKLVSVISGSILDVVVDLRLKSPTVGEYAAVLLNPDRQMYVPPGFAHGFLSKSDEAHVVYQTSKNWNPDLAKGIMWNDPDLKIDWGINEPIISDKDKKNMSFKEYVHSRYLPEDI